MNIELEKLIVSGESETVEFKTSFGHDCIQTLSAFANTSGGTVLIGISDAGDVVGVATNAETLQNWINTIKQSTSPSIIPDVRAVTLDDKTVVLLQVDEFPVKPVACRDRYFRRVANSNHRLSLTEIANLHLQSLQLSWDAYPGQAGSGLHFEQLRMRCRRFSPARHQIFRGLERGQPVHCVIVEIL